MSVYALILTSCVTSARDTLSHVETMSVVKGPGPAGVPSLFLPANENERRMPHSVSSPLLLNKGDSPQLTNNTHHPKKGAQLRGLQCYSTDILTLPLPYYAAYKHTQHKRSWVTGHQGCCQKARVVRRGS